MWKWPDNTEYNGQWVGAVDTITKNRVWHFYNYPDAWSEQERDYWGVVWVEDEVAEETIDEILHRKLNEIQLEKNRVRDGGFQHNGVHFDSDAEARLAYLELSIQLSIDPAYSTQWKASSRQWVNMDLDLFNQVLPAYKDHIEFCFEWQGLKEYQLTTAYNSGDKSQLESISTVFSEY